MKASYKSSYKPKRGFWNFLKKALSVIFNIFLVCAFVASIAFIVIIINARKNGGDLSLGDYRIFNIVSGSMEPKIGVGSIILVKKTDPAELREGDVISFRTGSIVVTHRVYDIYTQKNNIKVITTKGDANKSPDNNVVFPGQIIGKVTGKVPLLGYAFNFITTKTGMLTIVVIPLFTVFFIDTVLFFIEMNKYLKLREDPIGREFIANCK